MRTALSALAIVVLGSLLGGCTHQSADQEPLPPPTTGPASSAARLPSAPVPSSSASVLPSTGRAPSPSPSAFSEAYVVACNGRPTGEQVIAAARRARPNLPAGSGMTVKNAPLCTGTWQYTVLNVVDSEPLQVVTRGAPTALTLVTAGTDVCTVEVKATAPIPLLNVANC